MRLPAEILVMILVYMEIECQYRADPSFAHILAAASGGSRSSSTDDSNSNSEAHSAAASASSQTASTARHFVPHSAYQYSNSYSATAAAAAAAATQYDGYVAQTATLDASGMASLKVKLDLHVLLEKLNLIPFIQQSMVALNSKLDQVLNNNPTAAFAEQVVQLERQLLARLDEQDNKVKSLFASCQQVGNKLADINRMVTHTQQLLSAMQSSGFGQIPPCNLAPMEGKVAGLGSSLTNLVDMVRRMTSLLDISTLLKPISKTQVLVEQAVAALHRIGQPGYLCPMKSLPTKSEQQMLQQIGSAISMLQGLPQTIISGVETSQKGQNSQIMPYLLKLQQWAEHTAGQVVGLQGSMRTNTADIKRYFVESQKSLMSVKKIVTETTEVVQNSAAAATAAVASASRSLCHRGKKDDLTE